VDLIPFLSIRHVAGLKRVSNPEYNIMKGIFCSKEPRTFDAWTNQVASLSPISECSHYVYQNTNADAWCVYPAGERVPLARRSWIPSDDVQPRRQAVPRTLVGVDSIVALIVGYMAHCLSRWLSLFCLADIRPPHADRGRHVPPACPPLPPKNILRPDAHRLPRRPAQHATAS